MKKILFIIGSLSNGGAERVVATLSAGLSEIGYKITIVTIFDDKNIYVTDNQIKIVSIKSDSKNKVLKSYKIVKNLRKHLHNADVVISFTAKINMYVILANSFLKKRIIVSERSDPSKNPANKITQQTRNFLYNYVDALVCQTPDALEYFPKGVQKKSVIIPNPLPDNLPNWNESKDNKTIITACRLNKVKNLPMLIRAFKLINDKRTDYKLKIYGTGEIREELLQLVYKLNLQENVELPGFTQDIHNEMSKSSLFVISSDYEGTSNSMLEALAIGLPVISTDAPIGGARMFIKNNYNGILVNVGDVEGLANSILKIIDNPSFAKNLSKNTRNIRNDLNKDKIIKEWEKIILKKGEINATKK